MPYEPPLHQAVIDNNSAAVKQNLSHLNEINDYGYTALELARYLDRKEIIPILQPDEARIIKVIPRDTHQIARYTPQMLKKNVGVNYLSALKFRDYAFLKEVIRDCPYLLRTRYTAEENLILGERYRTQISRCAIADVSVQWIDSLWGFGLFANSSIKKGTYIGEYTGNVRRLYRTSPNHNAYCFHYPTRFWSVKYYVIDSLREGNQMRFANHSDNPTMEPKCAVDRGLLHLIFFTLKDIESGEQLTFNYGEDFWHKRHKQS